MERRPIQIVFLALIQLLTPFWNIMINSFHYNQSPMRLISAILSHPQWYYHLDFFLVGPISAIAIFSVKKWSYPVFLSCTFWTAIANFIVWRNNPQAVQFTTILFLWLGNGALVTYFLLPQVRLAYFDPKVRWWEAKPRYEAKVQVFRRGSNSMLGLTLNFAEGGILLETSERLDINQTIPMKLTFGNTSFDGEGRVVWQTNPSLQRYGIQFLHTAESKKNAKQLAKYLDISGFTRHPLKKSFFAQIGDWFKNFRKTGHGLVPSPTEKKKRDNQDKSMAA